MTKRVEQALAATERQQANDALTVALLHAATSQPGGIQVTFRNEPVPPWLTYRTSMRNEMASRGGKR